VVFVDIDPDDYTIDTAKIEEKINNKTKAIIPVHLYGHSANMSKIMAIAKKYNLKVVEDCAQAHFAKWQGKYVGSYGDAGTFSFFPGKNLGAYGDAGCIITNDDDLAEKMRRFSKHGALGKHDHEIEGINSRMDGIQAGILSVKLNYIHQWTELRIQHALTYNELLYKIKEISLPIIRVNTKHVFHLYVIRIKNRTKLQSFLKLNGISTGIHYPTPLPFLKAYDYLRYKPEDFPVAYRYKDEILSLPIFPELNKKAIEFITMNIKKFYNQ
jgi:dTDP-4-amino-4,6-dideoxygalactose transaminase